MSSEDESDGGEGLMTFTNPNLETDDLEETIQLSTFVGDSRRLSPPPRTISPIDNESDQPSSAPTILQNERASSIATRLQERLKSGDIRTEFEALNQEKPPGTYFEANLRANASKNRYRNVKPQDQSRVVLQDVDPDMEGSDYINASFISSPLRGHNYIAAQGPLPKTVPHFWQMIWEEDVQCIVMLANCVEGGKAKCEKYWPELNDSVQCGSFSITCTEQDFTDDLMISRLVLSCDKSDDVRPLTHFQYMSWPDFGVPESPAPLLELVLAVNECRGNSNNPEAPVVVHCSAGIGRTGTYCVVATCLETYEGGDNQIDIRGTLYQMRGERAGMVQSVAQYELCHQAIADALLRIPDQKTSKQPKRVCWSDKLTGTPEVVALQRRTAAAALRSSQAPQPQQATLSADYHRRGSVDSPLLKKPVPLCQPPPYPVTDSTSLAQSEAPQLPQKTGSVSPDLPPKPATPVGETQSRTPPSPDRLQGTVAEHVSINIKDEVGETSADRYDNEEQSSQTLEYRVPMVSTEDTARIEAKSGRDNATDVEIPSNQEEEAACAHGDMATELAAKESDPASSTVREDGKEEDIVVARIETEDRGSSDTTTAEGVTDSCSLQEKEQDEVLLPTGEIGPRNDLQREAEQPGENSVTSESPQQAVTEEEKDHKQQVTITGDELTETRAVDSDHENEVVTHPPSPQQQVSSQPVQHTVELESGKRVELSAQNASNEGQPDDTHDGTASVALKNESKDQRTVFPAAGDEKDEHVNKQPVRIVPVKAPLGASLPRNDGKVGKLSLSRLQAFAAPKTEPTIMRKNTSPKPVLPKTVVSSQPNTVAMSETDRKAMSKVEDNPKDDKPEPQRPAVVNGSSKEGPVRPAIGKLNTSLWESQIGGREEKRALTLPQKKAPIASTYLGGKQKTFFSPHSLKEVSTSPPRDVQPKSNTPTQSVDKFEARRDEKTTMAKKQTRVAKAASQPPTEKSAAVSSGQSENKAYKTQTDSGSRNAQRDAERKEATRAIGDSLELQLPDSPQPIVRNITSRKSHASNRQPARMASRQLTAPESVTIELTEEEKRIMAEAGNDNDDLIGSLMSVAADATPKPKQSTELTEEEKQVLETMGQNEDDSNLVNSLMNM